MRLLTPLSWLLGADAYASYMVTRFCDRPITAGTMMMCCAAQNSAMRTVSFRRNGAAVPCGSGRYVPGETLTAHISSVSGQYVFEISGGDAQLSNGGCPGRVRQSQANGAEVQAPTDGSVLSLKAAWAVASYGQVFISSLCELRVATTQTTVTTVTATTVTATTVTATTVTTVTATTTTATTTTATTATTATTITFTAPPTMTDTTVTMTSITATVTTTTLTTTATTATATIATTVTTSTFTAPPTMTGTTVTMTSITATVTTTTLTTTTLTATTLTTTAVQFTSLPFAEGQAYASVGGPGIVAADEGFTIGAYKEDCSANPDDTCFQGEAAPAAPALAFCEQQCTGNAACDSFTYCRGNSGAPFPRCYLKTRKLDFATKPHADCTTFKADGSPLVAGHVARTEGVNLASFKEDCAGDEFDTCHRTAPTFSTCLEACAQQDGCASFAYCTGVGNPGSSLRRCYLKAGNFSTVAHGAGDCASYYPRRAAKCTHLNEYYRRLQCCGQPEKELDMNRAKPSGMQPI